ncbi:hypothetical protein AB0M11_31625 [Streptomyces sp. NPDC051987]
MQQVQQSAVVLADVDTAVRVPGRRSSPGAGTAGTAGADGALADMK